MVLSDRGIRVKRRLQGVAFLVVVAALLGLTIAVYNKVLPWQAADEVILQADRAGTQLVVPADVKLDGVLVGRVSGVSTDGNVVRMRLQIDKSRIGEIPANVVARILPKTLFGEKFVDLVIPGQPSAEHLQPGDVIPQDRSHTAIELQKVFDDLVPLLRTLNPAELSITLTNLADAVRNRGDALGRNISLVNDYFSRFNKDLPNFNHDIAALADVASTYADATPDLLALLHNFSVNAQTLTEKQDVYAQFLTGSADFAREATTVFGQNATRLINLAHVSAPVLRLYAQYSPVLECLPNGLAIYDRTRLEQAFGEGAWLHITLTPVGNRGAYTAKDKPKKSDITSLTVPPTCYGLPYGNHGLHPVNARFPGSHPTDNYACAGYTAPPSCPAPPPGGSPSSAGQSHTTSQPLPSLGGKKHRHHGGKVPKPGDLLGQLLGPVTGGGGGSGGGGGLPGGLGGLLVGPILSGMAVTVS